MPLVALLLLCAGAVLCRSSGIDLPTDALSMTVLMTVSPAAEGQEAPAPVTMEALFDFAKGRLRQEFLAGQHNTTFILTFERKVTITPANDTHPGTAECWLGDFTEELAAVRAQFIRSPEMFSREVATEDGGSYFEWDSFVLPREKRVQLFMEGAGGDAKAAETLADTRDIYHTSPTGVPLLRVVVHPAGNATTHFTNYHDLAKTPPGDEKFRTPKGLKCKEVPAGQPGREAGFDEDDEDDEDDQGAEDMEDDEVEDDEEDEGDEDEEDEEEEEEKDDKKQEKKKEQGTNNKEPKHTEL